MSESSLCIKTKKNQGEKIITLANKFGMINKKLKIQQSTNHIYIPIIRSPNEIELAKLKARLPYIELANKVFNRKKPQKKIFHQVLEDKLSPQLMSILPRALDIIGDIAIIDIPTELKTYKHIIGQALLETHKNVRTVLAKIGSVTGTYRLRELELIAGEKKTTTVHKEHGCQYQVDVASTYFSPRLSHEHNRVSLIIQEAETIVDLFAGVGPFSVLIAKKNPAVKVYAVDINPKAIELLKKNIRLNRVDNLVIPIQGNARQVVEDKLFCFADRVIMNLPEKSLEFVEVACKALKPSGGIVHYYAFIRLPDTIENAQLRFSKAVEKEGRKVDTILSAKTIRETAPYEWQIVLDAKII